MNVQAQLIDWWRRKRWTAPKIDRIVKLAEDQVVPADLDRHTIHLIEIGGEARWAIFECPCGRGHPIAVNLADGPHPHSSLDVREVTINTQVETNHSERRCRFRVTNGRVTWEQSP